MGSQRNTQSTKDRSTCVGGKPDLNSSRLTNEIVIDTRGVGVRSLVTRHPVAQLRYIARLRSSISILATISGAGPERRTGISPLQSKALIIIISWTEKRFSHGSSKFLTIKDADFSPVS